MFPASVLNETHRKERNTVLTAPLVSNNPLSYVAGVQPTSTGAAIFSDVFNIE